MDYEGFFKLRLDELRAEGRSACSPISNGVAAAFRAPSLVATFLGALEIVLDRALNDDWFASSFIVEVAVVCALAFVLMIPWEATRRNPTVDVRMVATRQFGACFLTMLATGAILLFPASPPARPGAVPHAGVIVRAPDGHLGADAVIGAQQTLPSWSRSRSNRRPTSLSCTAFCAPPTLTLGWNIS